MAKGTEPRVAILGCGPTGLLAAHACNMSDVQFDIYSTKRKSELYGSQYLHEPIPGLEFACGPETPVKYVVLGTPEEYRRKTHGKWWDGQAAPEEFEPDHVAWDIRQVYNALWNLYWRKINDFSIPTPEQQWNQFAEFGEPSDPPYPDEYVMEEINGQFYDLIISTVPRNIWRREGDEFIFSEGWALGDAPERGILVEDILDQISGEKEYLPDNTIICDGTAEVPWTRLSRVHGYTTVEWPHHIPQPHPKASMVVKPLSYTPGTRQQPVPSDSWLHVGRYGEWKKGVVVTDAYHQVEKALKDL